MVDINSPSSPDTGQDATAAPGHGSDPKNMPPTNTSDAENMPPSNVSDSKKKNPLRRATRKDHGHHEAEMKKTDQESDYEFADVSDPEEQYDFIMDKMMNMDEDQYQAYKKKHPRPNMSSSGSCGPEVAFKYLREMYDEEDEEDAKEAASAGSQPTKKQ
ncbi:hypothetical protein V499_08466 [Pseudogymnoascus sp. VKM F-103]|nr:hypothetical protein V499_08466 [Pseudogymnoascus sp. VKM F-103]